MPDKVKAVEFLASFPPIQSAIKVDGSGGARIQLDIPESEFVNFVPAMAWRGERLKITITLTDFDDETKQSAERKTTNLGRRRASDG